MHPAFAHRGISILAALTFTFTFTFYSNRISVGYPTRVTFFLIVVGPGWLRLLV